MKKEKWEQIERFAEALNKHRQQYMIPGSKLVIDESISRWYSLGGFWIGNGCPHYVTLERKPEDGM